MLLDCTLRDGGYINDWIFGKPVIKDIVRKLVEAGTDYIEVGFLRNCKYNPDKALFNNIDEIRSTIPTTKNISHYSVMALHNLYDISNLEENDGFIDLIRVTFHNYDIDEGLRFVLKVKQKGYPVSCNPINIMGYSDMELLNLIEKVNEIHPEVFSIVDTFGSMMQQDLVRIYSIVEHNLDKTIKIGLHLHENLGQSFSLAQSFINQKSEDRNCIIDGSLLGMGRVPGNLCIELLMEYLNRFEGSRYNVEPVYDAINDYIEDIRHVNPWGYSTAYALSAKYNLHRNYSEYLLAKGKLRTKDINYILAGVDRTKKSAFDKAYIESLYEEYQNVAVDDTKDKEKLKAMIENQEIMLLAPGYSLIQYERQIRNYIQNMRPVKISVNFIDSQYGSEMAFFTNLRRYDQNKCNIDKQKILITSNIHKEIKEAYAAFDFYRLACDERGLFDNSMIMLLRLLYSLNIKKVAIAGFDGFSDSGINYASVAHGNMKKQSEEENGLISNYVNKLKSKIDITYITPSKY